ncbi:hypothetical protein IOCL1545_000037000 [Leishmania shawi]|uniref:Uncharacterized protein n=1 Tax=Leishmania shawi TaxID=5680 RepID=A0ABR3EGR8_9TRYP
MRAGTRVLPPPCHRGEASSPLYCAPARLTCHGAMRLAVRPLPLARYLAPRGPCPLPLPASLCCCCLSTALRTTTPLSTRPLPVCPPPPIPTLCAHAPRRAPGGSPPLDSLRAAQPTPSPASNPPLPQVAPLSPCPPTCRRRRWRPALRGARACARRTLCPLWWRRRRRAAARRTSARCRARQRLRSSWLPCAPSAAWRRISR